MRVVSHQKVVQRADTTSPCALGLYFEQTKKKGRMECAGVHVGHDDGSRGALMRVEVDEREDMRGKDARRCKPSPTLSLSLGHM